MNLGELKTHVKRQFGDEASVQITDADILRWVKIAQEDIVRENEDIIDAIIKQDLIAQQDEYAFPSDALTIRSLRIRANTDDPRYIPVQFMSNAQFERSVAGYEGLVDNFQSPYVWTSYKETIFLFPVPKNNVTDGIRILYAQTPIVPTLDADPLGLPLEYHSSILQSCLVHAYEMDENWEASGNKLAQLQASINRRANRSKSEARETYPTITVMPEDM